MTKQVLPPQQEPASSKKRTRVTPAQLRILEDTFSVSATPDSKMRKILAQKLQMPERSIQIWFQNRRAKVKLLQRRALLREEQDAARAKMYADAASSMANPSHPYPHGFHGSMPPPPPYWYTSSKSISPTSTPMAMMDYQKIPIDRCWSSEPMYAPSMYNAASIMTAPYSYMSPSPSPAVDDLHVLGLSSSMPPEDVKELSGCINANAITIGTWHRMKINQQDLQCCFQLAERTFEWHIRDSSYHFKMVVPFDTIACLDISILENGIFAQMDIDLTEPPLFFMETMDDHPTWIQCSDFTEGMQATCQLRHSIRGLATDLQHDLLQIINMDSHLCQVIRFHNMPNPSVLASHAFSNGDLSAPTTTVMPSHLMADPLPPLPF
ncbi:homeobox-domain-containing protein [Hesseltinella vesiculosa]|uniref:Homeobox-domain-containing protein n=1 Tax=Hesseltinella vesiculosa TaxID=101127 RepID=A0A1X2GPX9_9FUNG|nr:homeobox-domain-containing protein [Hesseltinella vesiculosa]